MYICQICKKKKATIHLTDIHNNIKKEVHICETCAAEKGFNLQGASNLPQLLGLAAKKPLSMPEQPGHIATRAPVDESACPQCGMTWTQFGERGRLGCPHDYEALDDKLRLLVSNQIAPHVFNQEAFHVGKVPGKPTETDQIGAAIRSLEKRLRQAVAEENYELAAKLKAELDDTRRLKAE